MYLGEIICNKIRYTHICSTTTFSMNKHTAKLMKQRPKEIFRMLMGMPRINKKIKILQEKGYKVKKLYKYYSKWK